MSSHGSLLIAGVGADGKVVRGSTSAIVPWWSFSKTLLAVCVMRLVEAGRLQLDDPREVGAPLAGAPHAPLPDASSSSYTVRQLLQHTSGIGDYGSLAAYHEAVAAGEPAWSDATLYRLVPPTPRLFAPGAGWAYSNVGYLLLRRLVERILGCGLAEALDHFVLQPLRLRDVRVASAADDLAHLALPVPAGYDPGWVFHGLVIGPVDQAAVALHRLWHGDLLSPSARAAIGAAISVGGPIAGRPWVRPGYGLGVMVGTTAESGEATASGAMSSCSESSCTVIGHSAGGPGSSGAVYTTIEGPAATVASFTAGHIEAPAEFAALRALLRLQSTGQLAT